MPVRTDYPNFRGLDLTKWWGQDATDVSALLNDLEARVDGLGSSGGAVRSLPEPAVVEAISAIQPTITTVPGGSTTTISSGIEAANLSAPIGKLDLLGTKQSQLVDIGSGYWASNWKAPGLGAYPGNMLGLRTTFMNSRYLELSSSSKYYPFVHIWVNDRKLTNLPFFPSGWGTNFLNTFKLDFGASYKAITDLTIWTYEQGLKSIWLEPGGSLWSSGQAALGDIDFWLGDSVTQGAQTTGYEIGSIPIRFGNLTGVKNVFNGGVSGTGPGTAAIGGTLPFRSRLDMVLASNATRVFIFGWYNDKYAGRTGAQIRDDLLYCVGQIAAMPTNPEIYVIGAGDPLGVNGSDFSAIETVVKAGLATQQRAGYISPVDGSAYNRAGVTVLPASSAWITTANKAAVISSADNIHPNDYGDEACVRRIYAGVRAIKAAA